MKKKHSISSSRKKVVELYRRFRAILILTKQVDAIEKQKLDFTLKSIPTLPQTTIDFFNKGLPEQIQAMTEQYGAIGSTSDMEWVFDFDYDPRYPVHYVPKYQMDQLFNRLDQISPAYSGLPPHARVGIELDGRLVKEKMTVFILEEDLFSDMVILWNKTFDIAEQRKSEQDIYAIDAHEQAFFRATVKAAFNLLEGYLNGMAFDITKTRQVSVDEEMKLSEWDKEKERPRLLTLRDKILQYPKIALGVQHPVLSESNCAEMGRVLDFEKRVRHALIHPNPKIDEHNQHGFRELVFMQLTTEETGNLCDDILEVIFKLHSVTNGMFGQIDKWLYRRNINGKFDEKLDRNLGS